MKKLLCIMGKSGSGKSTVISELCKDDRFHYVKSYSTNTKRVEEIPSHIYVSENKLYSDLLDKKVLATYDSPNGYTNWVSDDLLLEGKINVLAIDSIAYTELSNEFKNVYDMWGIYFDVDEDVRRDRLAMRGDTPYYSEEHLSSSHLEGALNYSVVDGSGSVEENVGLIYLLINLIATKEDWI